MKQDHKLILRDLRHLIRVYPESKKVLAKLRKKGFKLVIFSNSHRDFLDLKLETTGLAQYFDGIYSLTSDFKSVKKPELFEWLAKKMKVKPSQIVHIGDFYHFDFIIPRRAGIHTVFLKRNGLKNNGKRRNHSVTNLNEFYDMIIQDNNTAGKRK